MSRPIIHHRTAPYAEIFRSVREDLKYVFQTRNDVLVFTSSGTGAMQGAVCSFLSEGDKVIVIVGGKFGERWIEICSKFRLNAIPIDVRWGDAVDPEAVGRQLKDNPDTKAVFATLSETSTGVLHDIESIGNIVKETDAILVIDSISGLGANEMLTDRWHVDINVSGSQKGLMLPPGLAFASVSDRAWGFYSKSSLPKYYFDYGRYREAQRNYEDPFTGAIPLVIGLREALKMIKEEGLQNVISRHHRLAEATRLSMKACGLQLFASRPSNVLTAVSIPAGIEGGKFVKGLREKYGVIIAGGQDRLKGKIFRVAHLGWMDDFDIIVAVSSIEMMLKEMGFDIVLGRGVAKAEEVFLSIPRN
jgi:aspartate aminotransferase-like enzyme